jgi:hypothetical protein
MQGGGLATVLGDDFLRNIMLCRNCTFNGNNATTGEGVYQSGGTTTFASSTISANRAPQQGGGIAFTDVCGEGSIAHALASACSLTVAAGTAIAHNFALVGGGVFVATPGTRGTNTSELMIATARGGGNIAVYSADVALAPGHNSLALAQYAKEAVASSIGTTGEMGLVVSADRTATRLHVDNMWSSAGLRSVGGPT